MLRYADAIVKCGVDKLIEAIENSPKSQTKNAETLRGQKRVGNDTDCAPQTTGSTTNCGLTEQAISLMNELYDIRYNVLDRTPEVQRRDMADKGFVPVSKLVRNTMVTAPFNGAHININYETESKLSPSYYHHGGHHRFGCHWQPLRF